MKGFARSVPQMLAGRRGSGNDVALLAEIPDARHLPTADRFDAREEIGRLLGHLSDREQTVVRAQFGLEGAALAQEHLTHQLGVTPQQLRQIEKTAIAKLCPELIDYFGSGARPSMLELAMLHAAARCRRVFIREGQSQAEFMRGATETASQFFGRLARGAADEPRPPSDAAARLVLLCHKR